MSLSFDPFKEYEACQNLYQNLKQKETEIAAEDVLYRINTLLEGLKRQSSLSSDVSDLEKGIERLKEEIEKSGNQETILVLFESIFPKIEKCLRDQAEEKNISKEDFSSYWSEKDYSFGSENFSDFMMRGLMPYLAFGKEGINKKDFLSIRFQSLPIATHDDTLKKVRFLLEENFSGEPIICFYPGGGFKIVHALECVQPDVIVILDPDPSMKKKNMPQSELLKRYKQQIQSLKGSIISEEVIGVNEKSSISYASNVGIKIRFRFKDKECVLFMFTRGAGEEFFTDSPLLNGAHVLLTRLPTFPTEVSFPALKNKGLFISFTPGRDGKDIRGNMWQNLMDYTQIPIILKKQDIFSSLDNINALHQFSSDFDSLFIDSQWDVDLFVSKQKSLFELLDEKAFKELMRNYKEEGSQRILRMKERLNESHLFFLPKKNL